MRKINTYAKDESRDMDRMYTKLIQAHEKALDRVLRANVAGNLTEQLKAAAIEAGYKCGLSPADCEQMLNDAIECSNA